MSVSQRALLSRELNLPITAIDSNLESTIESTIRAQIEGKCTTEGYVLTGSVKVSARDAGLVDGTNVRYKVALTCEVYLPVEGMVLNCVAKTVTTTAGIRAELDMSPSPFVVYLARDHHLNNASFNAVKVGDKLKAYVIGQRFELNDPYISVIARLLDV